MKKIYLTLALAVGLMTTSCELDIEPVGYLPTDSALETPSSFNAARATLYAALKGCVSGNSFINSTDVQSDQFNAMAGFSNTLGDMYRWDFTTQTGSFSSVYGGYQGLISQANFIIDGYAKAKPEEKPDLFPDGDNVKGTEGLKIAHAALGDAYFMRAYAIFGLLEYYSPAYSETNATQPDLGASYNLHFSENFNPASYPGRNTLEESYKQVNDDLDKAMQYVTTTGIYRSEYVTLDCIHALRARVALNKKDYVTAYKEAELVIKNTTAKYALCSSASQLVNEWYYDGMQFQYDKKYNGTSESLFTLVSSSTSDLPSATGGVYLPKQVGSTPDYIPTKDLLSLYDAKDYRRSVFFTEVSVVTSTGAAGRVQCLNKFNKEGILWLMTSKDESAEFTHMPKVFRLPEMYLIAAEAYALAPAPDLTKAAKYLNDFRKKRISGFKAVTYTDAATLLSDVKDERAREFVGEGFRFKDLKRYGMGVKRGVPQQRDLCSNPGSNTTDLNIAATDYRMLWPIPKDEVEVNKKLKQNPGY